MAQFFEKIEAESKGRSPAEFFSNHPSPEHRMERVNDEVEKLGGPPSGYKTASAEFREIKRYVLSLPAPPNGARLPQQASGGRNRRPDQPSSRLASYEKHTLRMPHPNNCPP